MKKLLCIILTFCLLLSAMIIPTIAQTEKTSQAISGINYYNWDFSEDTIYTDYYKAQPHPQGLPLSTWSIGRMHSLRDYRLLPSQISTIWGCNNLYNIALLADCPYNCLCRKYAQIRSFSTPSLPLHLRQQKVWTKFPNYHNRTMRLAKWTLHCRGWSIPSNRCHRMRRLQ